MASLTERIKQQQLAQAQAQAQQAQGKTSPQPIPNVPPTQQQQPQQVPQVDAPLDTVAVSRSGFAALAKRLTQAPVQATEKAQEMKPSKKAAPPVSATASLASLMKKQANASASATLSMAQTQTTPSAQAPDFSELAGIAESDADGIGGLGRLEFADETPVDAPTRQLSPEMTAQQLAFVDLLDSVHTMHHNEDAIKGAVQNIMMEMRETPILANLLVDEDVTIIVRRMKYIMGFRKQAAVAAAGKRKSRAMSAKQESAAAFQAELLDALGDLGVEL